MNHLECMLDSEIYTRLQKSCNKQTEPRKTTIVLEQRGRHTEVGKIIRFICGKSIVVFHCSAGLLQDFHNLLYQDPLLSDVFSVS